MKVLPCFVDETGVVPAPDQPLFAVGAVLVREVCDLTDSLYTTSLNFNAKAREHRKKLIRQIRQGQAGVLPPADLELLLSMSRHHEYKFTEIRDSNIKNYIAFLRVFFTCTTSEFHCIVIERSGGALKYYGNTAWSAYVHATSTLLAKRLKEPVFVCADW